MLISASDLPGGAMTWHDRQIAADLERLEGRIPARYRELVPLHRDVAAWAEAGSDRDLFLTGRLGVGKTAQAWTAVRTWYRATVATRGALNLPAIATFRSTALFDKLREFTPETAGLVRQLQDADLLFLDDIAAARPTDFTREKLFEIIDERYVQMRPVIVTSDVVPAKLEPFVGPRVVSRLAETCTVVGLAGADRRRGGAE